MAASRARWMFVCVLRLWLRRPAVAAFRGMYVPRGATLGTGHDGATVFAEHALVVLDVRTARDGWILEYRPLWDLSRQESNASRRPTPVAMPLPRAVPVGPGSDGR